MIRMGNWWFFRHDGVLYGHYRTFREALDACLRFKRRLAVQDLSVQTPRLYQTFQDVLDPMGFERRQKEAA